MGNLLNIAQKRRLAILNKVPAIVHLSYDPTTELNLLIETQSGDDWKIDWGDGVWERYASRSSTYVDKTFGTATSGVARVRSATGRGLSDLHRIQSTKGTWSFDITALSGLTSLTYLYIQGQNTLTGLIDNAPAGLISINIQGQNTLSGLIDNAPAGLTSITITGQNTLSGLIDNAPAGLISISIQGQNTLTGLIDNAPVGLTFLNIQGQNTLSGLIDNAPAGLTFLFISGQNTLSGLIDNAPVRLTTLYITGLNTLTYTGRQWVENQDRHIFRATQFNSQMVDQYLIDLSAVTNWRGNKTVDLRVGVAPTPASASAIAILESRGVTVLTS